MPGTILVEVRYPDGRQLTRQLTLKAGETSNFEVGLPLASAATPVQTGSTPVSPAGPTSERATTGMSRKTVGYVFGAVGIVGVGAFVGFALIGAASYGNAKNDCTTLGCPQSSVNKEGSKGLMKGIGYAGLGIGIAGLGAGTWLVLSGDSKSAATTSLQIGPMDCSLRIVSERPMPGWSHRRLPACQDDYRDASSVRQSNVASGLPNCTGCLRRLEVDSSEAITRNIRIQVQSRYLPERSAPPRSQWFFAYTIRIANEGHETIQLLTRHWVITDATGHVEEVKGDEVVGEQPVIEPGNAFEYSSGCPLTTPFGSMRGEYQMITHRGEQFDVTIPAFVLRMPGTMN